MMNLSGQKFLLIRERLAVVVILVALGFAFNTFVYAPYDKKVSKLKGEVADLRSEAARYRALSAAADSNMKRLEEVTAELKNLEAELSSSGRLLPPAGDASIILREITAPHPGMDFISIRPFPLVNKTAYAVLPVALQIRGPFPSLGGYLSKLDASEQVIYFNEVSIVKETDEGLMMTLNLDILMLPGMGS